MAKNKANLRLGGDAGGARRASKQTADGLKRIGRAGKEAAKDIGRSAQRATKDEKRFESQLYSHLEHKIRRQILEFPRD